MKNSKKVILLYFVLLFGTTAKAADLTMPDAVELIGFLKEGDYKELERRYTDYSKQSEKKSSDEAIIIEAFSVFENSDPELLQYLNTWIALHPESAFAYLARGVYYYSLGTNTRGTKFIDETSEAQMEGMRKYHVRSINDIEKAARLNPRLSVIYAYGISVTAFSRSGKRDKDKWFRRGLLYKPYSFAIHRRYIYFLRPRWERDSSKRKKGS